MDLGLLERLRAFELARRWMVAGVVVMAYAAGWSFLTWRATRAAETECTVLRVDGGPYCTVAHTLDGERQELPWEDCDAPTRWGRPGEPPPAVGTRMSCFYYRSFPADIVFTRPIHPWPTPPPIVVAVAGALALGFGVYRHRRASTPSTPGAGRAHGYRAAPPPSADRRSPLEIPLARLRRVVRLGGVPFLLLGIVLFGATLFLLWETTGELGVGEGVLFSVANLVLFVGAYATFYRSDLVVDGERRLVVFESGLVRPWFRTYASLDALLRVETEERHVARSTTHYLVIHFADAKPWSFSLLREESDSAVYAINAYIAKRPEGG